MEQKKKKELTPAQKADLAMKYEIAAELGLADKIEKEGWKALTSRESGRIGGIMGKRKRECKKEQPKQQETL
ncbi:small, acid-soluble spore protein, alpha/beta type [Anaerotignum lactatifermentans]|uniref:Small, acid-soluble spore protein, alpha/beta type n=1 Tax=Anaerotignum lactatifermentans TaxID=160404 RepID=A0ABS2GA56_9FIRM|nr:small, acid-soluble spore protein, alpha/beta type [Anaerotignum lactatifermentans]MBM6828335.1 small, acid-soluble spore protein, alpha/beta type [Anaerotignum lactatifermentans]MBM6877615.1 small, acid-soluble spore protein, alpha/beta type [Anaerotignum lactatifermentans]MBM6949918.1 small, acid-soluble spore protein, alpha/beta type [Anaerotignum lactatifermentans]